MLNKVILQGRLTNDPEVKALPNGTFVTRFSLAVGRDFKKEGQPDADFLNIIAFGKTAEFVGKYFTKGMQALVDGKIQTGSYDNKEGKKVYTTDIVCNAIYFTESKKEANNQQQNDNMQNDNPFLEDGLPF